MDNTLTTVLSTSIVTACFTVLLILVFRPLHTVDEPKTKKLKQCPTCKRWQEVS